MRWKKGEANMIQHCGRAVFEAGAETETVEFSSMSELREIEDDLTWKHWPTELKLVKLEYKPAS
jgi:hypothetical protein